MDKKIKADYQELAKKPYSDSERQKENKRLEEVSQCRACGMWTTKYWLEAASCSGHGKAKNKEEYDIKKRIQAIVSSTHYWNARDNFVLAQRVADKAGLRLKEVVGYFNLWEKLYREV